MCVSLFYVIDTGSIGSRARIEMGVTYLPFTVSSDAGCADLPLPLLGAPVSQHRGSVCVSLFYVIDTGSIGSRARIEMGVTYLPSAFAQTLAMPIYP